MARARRSSSQRSKSRSQTSSSFLDYEIPAQPDVDVDVDVDADVYANPGALHFCEKRDMFLRKFELSSRVWKKSCMFVVCLLFVYSVVTSYSSYSSFVKNDDYVVYDTYVKSIEDSCNTQIIGLVTTICQMENIYNGAIRELATKLNLPHFPYHNLTVCQDYSPKLGLPSS